MEKTYRCVTGEIVSANDTVEYVYNREDIEPLLRDVFTLCYPKAPVMVNGMMFDATSIARWFENGAYSDPVARKKFVIEDIVHIYALKFVLLCLEDTFDDTAVVYKTVVDEAGNSKQVFDREATNELYSKAVVKFHAPPSNILHACRLAACLIGDNLALVDGQPANWIVDKRINENVEDSSPERVEINGPIRISAYAMNRNLSRIESPTNGAIWTTGAYNYKTYVNVSFGEVPQGFRIVGAKLTNCSNFDHLELIDCQIICDYKCYPLNYYVSAGVNNDAAVETPMAPCTHLVMGNNYTTQHSKLPFIILREATNNDNLGISSTTKPLHAAVSTIPPVYKSLRTVRHINDLPDVPATPIVNYQMPLQVGIYMSPWLLGALTPEEMTNTALKFDRCFTLMSKLTTDIKFRKSIANYTQWLSNIPTTEHVRMFKKGEYEFCKRRKAMPRMVDSPTWYDLSCCSMPTWTFRQCVFTNTTFAGSTLRSAIFIGCTFDNVDFTMVSISGAKFTDCTFISIQPSDGIECEEVRYENCKLVENIIKVVPGRIIVPEPVIVPVSRYDSDDDSDSD